MSDRNKSYTPKPCQGKDAEFSGQVIMRIPSYEERIDLMCMTNAIEGKNPEEFSKKEMLLMTRDLVKASYEYYVKVDITHKASKTLFSSVEDLRYSQKTSMILSDVATWLLNADMLGEN